MRIPAVPLLASVVTAVLLGRPPVHAATITVNSTADATASGDGNCTLREALANANAGGDSSDGDCAPGAGGSTSDTIVLAQSATYDLTGNELTVTGVIVINGNGATISAGGRSRIFRVTGAGNFETLTLNGLTLIGGSGMGADPGGCLALAGSGPCGGAVSVETGGTLAVNGSTLTANTAFIGGAVWVENATVNISDTTISNSSAALGGGIGALGASGRITIFNSTLSGNMALNTNVLGGGGIFVADAFVQIANTTLSGNSANAGGGGLMSFGLTFNPPGTAVLLDAVTITKNTADANDDGVGDGGGVLQGINGNTVNATSGSTVLMGCVVAGNIDMGGENPDIAEMDQANPPVLNTNLPCQQAGICSSGYNLIGNVGMTNFNTNAVGDLYGDPNGSTQKFLGSTRSVTAVNPLLGPLVGTPAHHPLLPGSPAIDRFLAADCVFSTIAMPNPLPIAGMPITTDGRGAPRPFDGDANGTANCDSGAYEYQGIADSCGNGTLDLGEQCDDGNMAAGDCCSATCRFEAAGSPCSDNEIVCTAGSCDSGGICVRVSTDAFCDDGDPCTIDTCDAGVCVASVPGLAGLTCTLDRLLALQCDGAPVPTNLQRKITRKVAKARRAVIRAFQAADDNKQPKAERFRARANKRLQGIPRLTAKAAKKKSAARNSITVACKRTVDALAQSRRQLVAGFAF